MGMQFLDRPYGFGKEITPIMLAFMFTAKTEWLTGWTTRHQIDWVRNRRVIKLRNITLKYRPIDQAILLIQAQCFARIVISLDYRDMMKSG